MDLYRLSVFAHIVLSTLLTGMVLYWLIMLVALGRRFASTDRDRHLQTVQGVRWPPISLPQRLLLPLPWLSWMLLFGLWGTGIVNSKLRGMPEGFLWWTKMALFLLIIALQVGLTRKPYPVLIRACFATVLLMIVVSGWVIR